MGVDPVKNAVIRFELDGYDVARPWLMGRQVAGHGFLRAAVLERGEGPLFCYTAHRHSALAFQKLVRGWDPAAEARWLSGPQLASIGDAGGVLYLPDASLPLAASARLRVGVNRYSLCGVTHTTATAGTMGYIADLLTAPVAPWDALVCTSTAVAETVRRVHDAQAETLRWRLGENLRISLPQLPVIPLGVHGEDYAFTPAVSGEARAALGLEPDDVAALFIGRLTFTGKHHPFAMYRGLQAAAERTGKRVVLLLCGWAPNDAIESAFVGGAKAFAPDVRTVRVDGRDVGLRGQAWAAADIFVSLSDGIQETFGLTPIEAMAAGLPCVVTDWNGYKDTVRDGIDGFRVRTWAPEPGAAGEAIAREQEVGTSDYDAYLWACAAATAVDLDELTSRLVTLVENADLRHRMGEAGRRRAQETFEWRHILRQYQALWGELRDRREAAAADPQQAAWIARAPATPPARLDPFEAFGHYPSSLIGADTRIGLLGDLETYVERKAHDLFNGVRLPDRHGLRLVARLSQGSMTVAEAAGFLQIPDNAAAYLAGVLTKMGLVRLD